VKGMIDIRRQMTSITLQKQLETHLELQNANLYENIEEDYEEPEHLKDNNSENEDNKDKENEKSEIKEISSESMDKVSH
jgi:hypothetical protein